MRFPRKDKQRVKATVELTPLIDVVFQLLIFFMLSSTFVVQTSIPVEIPESEGTEQLEQKQLSITLSTDPGGPDDQGMVYVNKEEIGDWGELSAVLRELRDREPEALVLIRADENVSTGRLVKVLGITTSAGIQHYGIAAEPPGQEEQ